MHIVILIGRSLEEAVFMFWETLWALIVGFALSGAVQAFVSRAEMQRAPGGHGPEEIGRATFFGMVSSSYSYAASAMAKSLFQKGADFAAAMIFMFASTNLVVELGLVLWLLIGWQFTASEFIGGLIMIGLFALLARFAFPRSLVGSARRRLQQGAQTPDHAGYTMAEEGESPLQQASWRGRLTATAGWADAASYTMADVTMLGREMAIGYVIAGFLAVLVPRTVWNRVFLSGMASGHQWRTSSSALSSP